MSQAPNYTPAVSFATEETNSVAGRSTVRTVAIDTELANASSSINAINTNLKLLQRDDGKPKDFIIEPYALSEQTRALISAGGNPRGIWNAATSYSVGDCVTNTGFAYLCVSAHTSSSVFDSNLWMSISGDGSAAAYAIDSAASAAAALTSENNAETAASTATTKASEANASAIAASGSATNSANSAIAALANKVLTDSNVTASNDSAAAALASANAADVSEANAAQSAIDAQASVGAVKVSATDTVATPLETALQAGYGATFTKQNPSANEVLRIDIDPLSAFKKADIKTVAFIKTGAGTISIKAGAKIEVADTLQVFAAQTAIVMPTLTAGTDYAIYVCTDGTVRADASFTAPSGYTISNSRQIGGFHYAPGGNAAAQAGGNTTPAINEYSIWDLKFRPACSDPRGMALIADSFWADIYLLGVDYLTNGSSKYNVSIADGSAPPKRSTLYGGNGTLTYADGNWWNLNEALKHVGKRSPTYSEFSALAYGTTEATSSGGTDVPTTGVSGTGATSAWNLFTSKFGVIQATGCMWIWGDEFGGGAAAASYVANTQGRGSTYQMENAVLLGGYWGGAADSGSRASYWGNSPALSYVSVGARGVCDHLTLV